MPLVGRVKLRLYTSSSLFLHACACRHPFRASRGVITGSLGQVFRQDTCSRTLSTSPFRRAATSMGLVHGSANFHEKIKVISTVLQEDHGRRAADGLQVCGAK